MTLKIKWKPLLISLGIPLAVGAASAAITGGSMEKFKALKQPPLSPPSWLFPIVWTVLFVLMGIASYLVGQSDGGDEAKRRALTYYYVQLAVNFLWPILFFLLGKYYLSFFWLILLFILVFITAEQFGRQSETASRLLSPYLLWLAFAGYLNFAIAVLN